MNHRRLQHPGAYASWSSMITRCTNPRRAGWKNYGGRGITVCPQWRCFAGFLADMGDRPADKTLDRYPDANGNYEPGNCRWATRQEQARNQRSDVWIGAELQSDAAMRIGVNQSTLLRRLRRMPADVALNSRLVKKVKLCAADVDVIRVLIAGGHKDSAVAQQLGLSRQTVWRIRNGRAWA